MMVGQCDMEQCAKWGWVKCDSSLRRKLLLCLVQVAELPVELTTMVVVTEASLLQVFVADRQTGSCALELSGGRGVEWESGAWQEGETVLLQVPWLLGEDCPGWPYWNSVEECIHTVNREIFGVKIFS